MDSQLLTPAIKDRLAIVRLNRPRARNALARALMRELTACARELAERTDVYVVILTDSDVCFSAGADLKDANAWGDDSLSTVDSQGTKPRMRGFMERGVRPERQ